MAARAASMQALGAGAGKQPVSSRSRRPLCASLRAQGVTESEAFHHGKERSAQRTTTYAAVGADMAVSAGELAWEKHALPQAIS